MGIAGGKDRLNKMHQGAPMTNFPLYGPVHHIHVPFTPKKKGLSMTLGDLYITQEFISHSFSKFQEHTEFSKSICWMNTFVG